MDLIGEGMNGIIEAIDKFDPNRGVALGCYAMFWVRARITHHIARQYSIAQGGESLKTQRFYSLVRERAKLLCQHGSSNRVIELLAERFGRSETTVRSWLYKIDNADVSIDAKNANDGRPWSLASKDTWDPSDEIDHRRELDPLVAGLAAAIDRLTERQQQVVWAILDADSEITLQEIGNRIGVSRQRVQQLRNKAFEAIREYLEAA